MVLKLRAVTLLELIFALILLGIMVLSFTAIDVFCRHHVLSADKRALAQNEASVILEHMNKSFGLAIGNTGLENDTEAIIKLINSPRTALAFIDANQNGLRDPPGTDRWIGYQYDPVAHTLRFCAAADQAGNCSSGWNNAELLSNKVTRFDVDTLFDNIVRVWISACADPTGPYGCDTPSNPIAQMQTYISLPLVSIR